MKGADLMAKDDYFVLAYRILLYYYGCFKRKFVFDTKAFLRAVGEDIDADYLTNVLEMLCENEYLKGGVFTSAWGHILIMASDYSDLAITQKGIEYLSENSKMQKAKKFLIENAKDIAELISIVCK